MSKCDDVVEGGMDGQLSRRVGGWNLLTSLNMSGRPDRRLETFGYRRINVSNRA